MTAWMEDKTNSRKDVMKPSGNMVAQERRRERETRKQNVSRQAERQRPGLAHSAWFPGSLLGPVLTLAETLSLELRRHLIT